jgi:hypothetical protein
MLIRRIYFSCLLWLECSWKKYMRSENRQITIIMLKSNILQFLLSTDTKVMFIYLHACSSGNGFSELDRHLNIIWKTQAIFTRLSLHWRVCVGGKIVTREPQPKQILNKELCCLAMCQSETEHSGGLRVDKLQVSNYRTISLLAGFSKIFELLIFHRLRHHLMSNNILVN